MPLHIALFSQCPEKAGYLQQVIASTGLDFRVEPGSLAELPPLVNSETDLVLLEYQENHPDLERWIEQTTSNPKSPPVFLYFPEITTASLWKAMRLGVKECFAHPVKAEDFQAAVQRALARVTLAHAAGEATRVIALMGCKGGVGTTFLTANLAYLLARGRRRRVLAVDLDLRYGQLSYLFDLQPRQTIMDLPEDLAQLDQPSLLTMFIPYDQYLHLLPAPLRLEEAETVAPERMERILRHLKEHRVFSYILLDCTHHFAEVTLKALEMADNLVLVATPSLPALANARKILDLLKLLKLGAHAEVWLNAWQPEGDLTLPDVTRFLATEVNGLVPLDAQLVGRSINEGRPLVETAPKHPICQDLKALAARLAGESQEIEPNGSRWSWLRILGRKG